MNRMGMLPFLCKMDNYLKSNSTIDSDSEIIQEKARSLTEEKSSLAEKAVSIFYFTRDKIRYNPYASLYPLEASSILEMGYGFCVQKAVLLAALARASGIPARLGFVNIRNHRLDHQWQKIFQTDIVVFHGFTEMNIGGRWLKATSAFDLRMCSKNGFVPVDFDGKKHAMLHSHDKNGKPHIDYLKQLGSYDDVPVDNIISAVTEKYGPEFLECWQSGVWNYYLNN